MTRRPSPVFYQQPLDSNRLPIFSQGRSSLLPASDVRQMKGSDGFVAPLDRGVRLLSALYAIQEVTDVRERRGQAAGKSFDRGAGRIPALVARAAACPGFIVDAISLFGQF